MGDDDILNEHLLSSKAEEEGDLIERVVEESKKIWRVAAPSVISRVSSFGLLVVTQSFIGHTNSTDLAGYALVQSLTVQFVNGVLLGMSSATETLCGQAYGAKQYYMMGIYLQRSWLIELITLTILLPVFIFATPMFNLIGEDEGIAESAGYISLWFIPHVYGLVFRTTIQMYLQAQQKNMIIAWLAAVQFVAHILLSWILVSVFNLGTAGAMTALLICAWSIVIGEFVYIFCGWCPQTWQGFSVAAAKDLLPVVKLSIKSGLMVCMEMWYCAILVILAGHMENAVVSLSAFSICFNITAWVLMIFFGIMGASGVRVANELGRGDAKATKFSINVVMGTSFVMGLFFWIVCMVFSNKIGYAFTNDEEVVQTVSDLSLPLAFSMFLGSIFPVLSGVAIGAGFQGKVAVLSFICFYLIGLPLGALLGYVAHLQLKGIWIGLTCGVAIQTLLLGFMVWRTNWDEEVFKTSARMKKWSLNSSIENEQSHNHA